MSLVYSTKLEADQFIACSNPVIVFLFFDSLKPANFLTPKAFNILPYYQIFIGLKMQQYFA